MTEKASKGANNSPIFLFRQHTYLTKIYLALSHSVTVISYVNDHNLLGLAIYLLQCFSINPPSSSSRIDETLAGRT